MKIDKSWNNKSDRDFVLRFKETRVLIAVALAVGILIGTGIGVWLSKV